MLKTPSRNRLLALCAGLTLLISACSTLTPGDPPLATAATCSTVNLAQGKTATASSTENAGYLGAGAAVDGNLSTRWASQPSDPQWLQVDLGSAQTICGVTLIWEAAYGKAFEIQVSNDGNSWTPIYSTTTGTGNTQTLSVNGSGRYVRMHGTQRPGDYGYSLFEFEVFGSTDTGGGTGGGTGSTTCGTANAALNKPASASSTENPDYLGAKLAFDGNNNTRWASSPSDPQWVQVNLGSVQQICGVTLQWETARAATFQIQVSNDGVNFTPATGVLSGTDGTQTVSLSASGQYVRMQGLTRNTGYGYSLYEFQVFTGAATGGTTPPPPTTLPTSDTPDFGPNVTIFDSSMTTDTIQAKLNSVFEAQKLNQFGSRRDALLFKPGEYNNVYANIGYYTSIAGLSQDPTGTTINGAVTVDSFDGTGNATTNFWRSAENFTINLSLSGGRDRWAVAQAAPFRRMFVRGGLDLAPASNRYASGGYIADSYVVGNVSSVSQQQWYSRDSNFGQGWSGSVWNMVFSGVQGAPPQHFPNPSHTVLATTPVSREKPFLYFQDGKYAVFTPALRTNVSGPSWPNTPGTSVPMSQFYVAKPGDKTATLNVALAQGLNLFFTPGVYHLSETLKVTRPNTVVLGIGYPTLVPDNGVDGMTVADVDGVKLAGFLFDAGTVNSKTLLTVGTAGSHVNHAANPTTIQDVFFRIGGASAGKATNSLIVNSDNTIIDHIWAWRADHGNVPTGWTINTADTGLVVNGNNVLATGLFVEHYQKYEVIWNGQGGKTIFFQNEMPYDPPNQAAWQHDGVPGYAAYKVANGVTSHEAWGLGSYIYTNVDPTIHSARAFEVPDTSGVKFHDLVTVSLNNKGTIDHIINNTGAAVPIPGTNTSPSYLVNYP